MTAITGGSLWIIHVLLTCFHKHKRLFIPSIPATFYTIPLSLQYLWGDDPVVGEALRYVVAMLGETVGDVHRPGLTLMWGVEALREVWKRGREKGQKWGKFKRSLVWLFKPLSPSEWLYITQMCNIFARCHKKPLNFNMLLIVLFNEEESHLCSTVVTQTSQPWGLWATPDLSAGKPSELDSVT